MTQLSTQKKRNSRITNMTVLAAITLSSTKRSAPLFARAFSARSFGGFQQKSNNLILNQKDGQQHPHTSTIQRSIILPTSQSASALFFSTETDSEEKDQKLPTSTALGATVEDDLDTALDEILGAAFDEAGSGSTTLKEEEVGAFEAEDDAADADSDASASATKNCKWISLTLNSSPPPIPTGQTKEWTSVSLTSSPRRVSPPSPKFKERHSNPYCKAVMSSDVLVRELVRPSPLDSPPFIGLPRWRRTMETWIVMER